MTDGNTPPPDDRHRDAIPPPQLGLASLLAAVTGTAVFFGACRAVGLPARASLLVAGLSMAGLVLGTALVRAIVRGMESGEG